MSSSEQHQAIVIGGSIAGMLAARVLANYFEQVMIVERDTFSLQPEARAGVSQSPHAHILLTQGYRIVSDLFPGIEEQLMAQGALEIDWLAECPVLFPSGWAPRLQSQIQSITCSRNLLEFTIRQQLSRIQNVHWLCASTVIQLVPDSCTAMLRGVLVKDAQGQMTPLLGDLIVDASGRSSPAPEWLKHIGYPPPEETIIDSGLGYASQYFRRPVDFSKDWKSLYVMAKAPDHPHIGALVQVEGNRWLTTLMGINRHYPPTDDAGFLDFARQLRSPIIFETIKDAEPLSTIHSYRATANRQRHYEAIKQGPGNFIGFGDSICAFNPVYGQGMTVAAQSAVTLDQCLKRQWMGGGGSIGPGFSRSFHRQLAAVVRTPWLMATGEDLRWPQTTGPQPDWITKMLQRYIDQIIRLNSRQSMVYQAFTEVIHMLNPPHSLFQPKIMMNVLAALCSRDPSCPNSVRTSR
ncbi:2-polyprenyl-6-methoxyphenol hydroxylase-like oxidoreductase [Acaryochloris sp. IP29b_bin.148]|uniref:FAD-dependent oxidoreductase n=1 Tax=Acaryochloris sp. IP29b_bin.148 TaxID=2969218 RepID=UPI002636BE9A|nr:2-polyprenyl-6-methoxyphenol hydroxylase-like oxidoreductase [Acaryochloris sp. IP29b_bin.148]